MEPREFRGGSDAQSDGEPAVRLGRALFLVALQHDSVDGGHMTLGWLYLLTQDLWESLR